MHAIMEPITVTCDACGSTAFVHNVHYQYRDGDQPNVPVARHVLVAIEQDVECPTCGRRVQTQTDGEAVSG